MDVRRDLENRMVPAVQSRLSSGQSAIVVNDGVGAKLWRRFRIIAIVGGIPDKHRFRCVVVANLREG